MLGRMETRLSQHEVALSILLSFPMENEAFCFFHSIEAANVSMLQQKQEKNY